MEKEFIAHTEKDFPFLKDSMLLLAVSGGLDSVTMVHLCSQAGFSIALAHCNFRLRGEASDADEQFTRDLAIRYNVPFYVKGFQTRDYAESHKLSVQMAARELRYNWFSEVIKSEGYRYLLTAHHADDNLETFLINLSRGTGLDGLTGIPGVNGNIVRPLLPFSREEIAEYAKAQGLTWREDESNADTKYLRNKIRHEVIPGLKSLHPGFIDQFNTTLSYLQGNSAMVAAHVMEIRAAIFVKEGDLIKVALASLKNLRPLNAYLYELFHSYGFKEWNDVEQLLSGQSGKYVISATHRMFRDRDFLILERLQSEPDLPREYVIRQEKGYFKGPVALNFERVNEMIHTGKDIIYVDGGKLSYPLKLRKRNPGDRFEPFGLQGTKKLSKFFKDEKYSLARKERQWLLCDAQDRIVWVIGKRADNRFRVDETTVEILKIRLLEH